MPTKQELAAFKLRLFEAVQLLEKRLGRRVSQTEMAKRWKTSQPSVYRYIAGKGIPDRASIKRIAADCGVDPGWLDYGSEPADPSTPVNDDGEEKRARG